MTGFRLGIDYGTSNTVAMLASSDGRRRPLLFNGSPLLSSMVYADVDGRLLTGTDAVRAARSHPARAEPSPKARIADGEIRLGDEDLPVTALIAATLRTVVREAERVTGEPLSTATVTYPAQWAMTRRDLLVEAAGRAGLSSPVLLPEPVASARYFASLESAQVGDGQSLVVYDLGAGTCDVAVVRRDGSGFEPLAIGGLGDVGGSDLDSVVTGLLGAVLSETDPEAWRRLSVGDADDLRYRRALWGEAKDAKESLSRLSSAYVRVPILDRDLLVSREQFESAARPLIEQTAQLVKQVMTRSVVAQSQVAGLFLVGGASRVPLVATVIHQTTGIAPTILDQPELVVAEGCLIDTGTPVPAEPVKPETRANIGTAGRREARSDRGAARLPAVDPRLAGVREIAEPETLKPTVPKPAVSKPTVPKPRAAEPSQPSGKTSKGADRIIWISLAIMGLGCAGLLTSPSVYGTFGTQEAFKNPMANVFGPIMLVGLAVLFVGIFKEDKKKKKK
ncbi:Hsp70 family protein [Stackebrandtia endophytica]|nr:Hsp70 family protein [Stackebrandtia endophytica]